MFRNIEKIIPSEYLSNTILVGDFDVNLDVNSPERDLLLSLAKSLSLKIFSPDKSTRRGATLDFMIASRAMNITSNVIDAIVSDHKAVEWRLTNIQPMLRKSIKAVNQKLARMVSEQALYGLMILRNFWK